MKEFDPTKQQFHGEHEPKNFAEVLTDLEDLYKQITHLFHERKSTDYNPDAIQGNVTLKDVEEIREKLQHAEKAIDSFKKQTDKK